jgi:hypothetical protein
VNCQEPSEHDETDEAFTRRCRGQFWQVLAHLRKHRYPNAPAWAEGLPIFLAGGGARMSLYGREAEQVSRLVLKMWTRIARLVIRPLPNLLNISNDGIDQELFLRLAVAYGLSFDSFNIGEIYPPDATPDAGPRPKRDMPDYV